MSNGTRIQIRSHSYLFFISVILFQIPRFLYSWGAPEWFSSLPNATGFRLLLSLEMFFVCSFLFIFVWMYATLSRADWSYTPVFLLCFSPLLIFVYMVLLNAKLQILHVAVGSSDCLAWTLILAFSLLSKKDAVALCPIRGFSVWLIAVCIQISAGLLPFFSRVPDYAITLARTLIFIAASVYFASTVFHKSVNKAFKAPEVFKLSPRETEILELIVEGKTNDEIASALFISLSTVKTHIANIFEKMGVRNRLEAAALCRNI